VNIYRILHIASGKSYVGKNAHEDPEHRWKDHQWEAFNPRCSVYNTHFHRAIRKYGPEAFSFSSLTTTESLEDLAALEMSFIKDLKTNDPRYGYNSTTGGEAIEYNEIAREHMSDAQIKVWANSPERKKVTGERARKTVGFCIKDRTGEKNPFFGKTHSKKTKKAISNKKRGVPHAGGQKIAQAMKEVWKDPEQIKQRSQAMKDKWKDPEFRKKQLELFASEGFKEKCKPKKRLNPSTT
jgi:group I intron endonuclease